MRVSCLPARRTPTAGHVNSTRALRLRSGTPFEIGDLRAQRRLRPQERVIVR
jgi:hypothetical protein